MSAKEYLLGIDAGTTSVKTVLFDLTGHEVCVHVGEYNLDKPCPDFFEVDPEEYWKASCKGIDAVLSASGITPSSIKAVGITSQGETLICLDENGKPLRPAIVWLDNRAHEETKIIAEKFSRKEVYRITGQQEIVPCWSACKILWLRRHEPEIFERTAKFLMVEDYLIFRLTGEFATDHALCPSTLYYNMIDKRWWTEMLNLLGISENNLPELKASGEIAGTVNTDCALPCGIPVTVCPIDQITGAVGAGNLSQGSVTETTGSALAICSTFSNPVYDPQMRIGLYLHAIPNRFVLLPWTPTAGMILRWFRDNLGGGSSYSELSNEASKIEAGSDGLLMLPHLSGSVCPEVNPDARGVFYGLTLAHTRGHIVRSIFESVAFLLRENLELLKSLGLEFSYVTSLGGASRDRLWLQIKADVLGVPVVTSRCNEVTCLGAALLAGTSAGLFSSLEEAANQMIGQHKEYLPDSGTNIRYNDYYKNYLQLNERLFKRTQS